jgi:glycosyltransferase involved in cell wall biosynthesis
MVHVGNEVDVNPTPDDPMYLQRLSLIDRQPKWFLKHDIINADSQMQSLIEAGIHVEHGHLSDRKSIASLWKAGKQIRAICKKENMDVVHVLWGTTTGLITTLFSPKPVVISFCGSDLLGNKNANGKQTKGGRINRILSLVASFLANGIITKSENMKRTLPRLVRTKTTAIPNGIDLSKFAPMDRNTACAELGFDPHKKHVLFFYTEGQVVKNEEMARAVFSRVKETFPDAELVIATKIPHGKLNLYYNACDVMMLTSWHEGSNNSLKEANACNLPIVSVDVGDAKERLAQVENSFVLPDHQVEPFTEKVVEVLRSNQRSNGAKFAHEVSMAAIAQQVISVYKKAMS